MQKFSYRGKRWGVSGRGAQENELWMNYELCNETYKMLKNKS